jgi:iron complex outermembrane recepter protein
MRLFFSGICLSLSGWVLPMASALASTTASSTRNESSPCWLRTSQQSACPQIFTSVRPADLPHTETLMAQGNTVQITDVQIESSEPGFRIILNTPLTLPVPATRAEGNTLIVDVPNATLLKAFQQTDPIAGISSVTVTNLPGNQVRVAITGTDTLPKAEIRSTETGLSLAVITETQTTAEERGDEDEEELVVTGTQDSGYRASDSTTATKTDTPLRDIPGSIQVIPQKVIQDQGVTRISDAVRNVSGVTPQRDFSDDTDTRFNIRGFSNESATLRNGFRVGASEIAPNNIERIEVLKGPASVLYGQFEPGGVVNFVTKQPLSEPFYSASFTAGSFSFYEPSIDISGPLTKDKNLLYRLTANYQNAGSFRDFVKGEQFSIAPTLSYRFSDATKLTVGYEFLSSNQTFDDGLPIDPIIFRLPISRFLGEPDDFIRSTTHNLNAVFEHRFNENISLKSALGVSFKRGRQKAFRLFEYDPATQQIDRLFSVDNQPFVEDTLSWQTDLIGRIQRMGDVEKETKKGETRFAF